jgi:hypothetical protein
MVLCISGCAAGIAFSLWTDFGWLPIYVAGLPFILLAAPFPVKFRPWPLLPLALVMTLFGIGVPFVALFAGGSFLHLINLPPVAAYVAGTLVVFDAAW